MKHLLNPSQYNSIRVTLSILEENVREIENWVNNPPDTGILYKKEIHISEQKQKVLKETIEHIRDQILLFTQNFDFQPINIDLGKKAQSKMSECWADLIDIQSDKLKRYGKVNPQLKNEIDARLEKLAQLTLIISSCFNDENIMPYEGEKYVNN